MSNTNSSGVEIFRISLGPAANSITAHLCNLEGLACTGGGERSHYTSYANEDVSSFPLCDPNITHSMSHEQYVPRVLFVDGRDCFDPWATRSQGAIGLENEVAEYAWKGKVEKYHRRDYDIFSMSNADTSHFSSMHDSVSTPDMMRTNSDACFDTNKNHMNPNLLSFQSATMELLRSQSRSNRYQTSHYPTQQVSSKYVYTASHRQQLERHVNWDAKDQEDDEDHGDDEYTRRHRPTLTNTSLRKVNQLTRTMEESWDAFLESSCFTASNNLHQENKDNNSYSTQNTNTNITYTSTHHPHQSEDQYIPWMYYFMPPHPPTALYSAPLPLDCNTGNSSYLHSFNTGYGSSSTVNPLYESQWHEQILGEAVRKNLESCDTIRGFQVRI